VKRRKRSIWWLRLATSWGCIYASWQWHYTGALTMSSQFPSLTRPPRLLMVTTVALTTRTFLLPFAQHFRGMGWTVDAMAQGLSDMPECQAAFDNVVDIEWSRNPLDIRNMTSAPAAVRQAVTSGAYDLVHVHTPVAAFVTRFALRKQRTSGRPRVIYSAHGFHFHPQGSLAKNGLFRSLEKLAGRWTDYLVVVNHTDEFEAKRLRLVPEDRVYYMPGFGVDCDEFSPERVNASQIQELRRELGLTDKQPVVVMLAEFIARKRHQDVIHAFARVGMPEACLLLAGTGPTEPHMRELASRLGISERVRFLGFRRDVHALLRTANLAVLCSSQEGLPESVMESLCLATPVVATDIRGSRELVDDSTGKLVPVGDVAALAKAIELVLRNPEQAQAMGRRGRERMRGFDLSTVVSLHEGLYERALRQSDASAGRTTS
jgi:glycosyltransferase involved in cell wall biosynthesis